MSVLRNGDHFVARANSKGEERDLQRGRAGSYGDGVGGADPRGELLLEGGHFVAPVEAAARKDPLDRSSISVLRAR